MSDIKRATFTTISSSVSGNIGSGSGSGNIGIAGAGALPGNGIISSTSTITSTGGTAAAAMHRFGVPDSVTSHKSLNSVGVGSGTGNGSGVNNTGIGGNGGGSKATKTIRLDMELFAPNSNSFPEFNYSKLIYLEKKKLKKLKNKQNGFSDPFEENDDDVVRIAKELEKKYGTAYASGRGRSKKDDFCDIGLGYDESDSFIDNTEAYDEVIPEEVETVEGGFYINSGALVFKHLSTTEKTDEIIKMPNKPRKRTLSTSSEESSSSDDERDDNETDDPTTTSAAITNNPTQGSSSKVSTSKQKSSAPSEKRHKVGSDKESSDKEKSSKSKGSTTTSATSSVTVSASASPKDDEVSSEASAKEKPRTERTIKTTTVKDMLKAKRDNFLKMQEEELKTKISNGEVKSSNSAEDASGLDSTSEDTDSTEEPGSKKMKKTDEESDKLRQSDSKLPDLGDELLRDIQDMKDTAKNSNRIGKKFQFDDKLTEIFLRIDEACLCLDKNIRNTVFAHLEYQLSLPKYFLLRKAKQLRINQEKTKTKKAFVKLRKVIGDIMQIQSQQYQLNLKAVEDFQALHPGMDIHKLDNAPKMPRKKFIWNDVTRTLLYDLYQVRWMSYTVLRTRKETFEDFVANFLKEKVVNIWPNGWMKYEELKREIEKKKNVPKKLKENKKPDESPDNLCTSDRQLALNSEPGLTTNSKLPLNVADMYGMSTSSDVINANLKPGDVSKLIPAHSNSSADHLHSTKAYTSSNKVHRSSTNSPLNLCSGQGQSSLKGEKSSSCCVTNNNNNNNPNQNINSSRSSSNANMSKTIVDLVSPSKRTDHSINSIMSSPSSTSSSVSTTPQPQHSTGMGNTITIETNTHVINIDNFKSATEIINTSNQLINHSSKSHTNERLKGRSVTSDAHSHGHTQFKVESVRRDSSSESDGVEIVGVYQARNTASSLPLINKNKYKKSSHQEGRGESPGMNDKVKTAPLTAAAKKSIDNSDLDVNKIMKALKELEEMQHTGNFVPDISSLAGSNHNHNTNASPLAYGKDLTQ